MIRRFAASQAGRPRGLAGRLLGRVMAWHNRPDNEWTVDLLSVSGVQSVLEVGFGPGRAIKLLAEACPQCRVSGIDHSRDMLAAARRLNEQAIVQGRVSLATGKVEKLDFPDGAFDRAFSINCIYFWREPPDGLRELYRVLKAGGRLAITVRDNKRAAYEPFRENNIRNWFVQAGFSSIRAHRNGVAAHPLICVVGVK